MLHMLSTSRNTASVLSAHSKIVQIPRPCLQTKLPGALAVDNVRVLTGYVIDLWSTSTTFSTEVCKENI